MKKILLILSVIYLSSCGSPDKMEQLDFLNGNWKGEANGEEFIESWTQTENGYTGTAISLNGTDTTFSEELHILKDEENIFYEVKLNGKNVYRFKLTELSENKAVFEDKTHDFPQSISYKLNDNLMEVVLKGVEGGKTQVITMDLKKQ